jgi:hypothetical protein
VTTTLDYQHNLSATEQYARPRDCIFAHLGMLSMWAVAGLALTGLAFALGFGAEVVQALAVAG